MDDERRDQAGLPGSGGRPTGGSEENPAPGSGSPGEAGVEPRPGAVPASASAGAFTVRAPTVEAPNDEAEEDEWGQVRGSSPGPPAGGRAGGGRRRGPLIAGLAALVAALAIGVWWWLSRVAPPPEPEPEPVVEAPEPEAPSEPEEPPLPPLDESDPFLRALFTALSENPEAVAWLLGTDLGRHAAIAVDNVADGQSPRRALAALTPVEDFRVAGGDEELQVDPASFARYDSVAAGVAGVDMRRVAEAVVEALPLLETAYAELGRPDRTFREAVDGALDRLLAVPVPDLPILVREQTLRYEYQDPGLEDLDEASKHLLRLGPENQRRVQAALSRFASAFRARAPRTR